MLGFCNNDKILQINKLLDNILKTNKPYRLYIKLEEKEISHYLLVVFCRRNNNINFYRMECDYKLNVESIIFPNKTFEQIYKERQSVRDNLDKIIIRLQEKLLEII